MDLPTWRRALVLGGTRSGKSEFAERLLADAATVRYIATARSGSDPEWSRRIDAHRARRPSTWRTEEVGDDPGRLADLLASAHPDEAILVDEIGTWVGALLTGDAATTEPSDKTTEPSDKTTEPSDKTTEPSDKTTEPGDGTTEPGDGASGAGFTTVRHRCDELAAAVRACPARVVLVSPEVGLAPVALTPLGRAFVDALGTANIALAAACDVVVLVVAGCPVPVKGAEPAESRRSP